MSKGVEALLVSFSLGFVGFPKPQRDELSEVDFAPAGIRNPNREVAFRTINGSHRWAESHGGWMSTGVTPTIPSQLLSSEEFLIAYADVMASSKEPKLSMADFRDMENGFTGYYISSKGGFDVRSVHLRALLETGILSLSGGVDSYVGVPLNRVKTLEPDASQLVKTGLNEFEKTLVAQLPFLWITFIPPATWMKSVLTRNKVKFLVVMFNTQHERDRFRELTLAASKDPKLTALRKKFQARGTTSAPGYRAFDTTTTFSQTGAQTAQLG